jgi:hypothetical protein
MGGTSAIGGGDTTDSTDAGQGQDVRAGMEAPGSAPGRDAASAPVDAATSCDPPPSGWTRVAYTGDRKTECPGGSAKADLIEHPTAGAGACTCGTKCTIMQHQNCTTGALTTYYDNNAATGQCDTKGVPLDNTPASTCDDQGQKFALARHFSAVPPEPTGQAQCAMTATPSPGALTSTQVRTCAPGSPTSCELISIGDCISAPGAVACPSGTPWQTEHLVGTNVTLACASVACACTVTTKCTGVVEISDQNDCLGGKTKTFPVDGKCYSAPNETGYQYSRYIGSILSEACAGTPPSPQLTLVNAKTVCCR